MEIFCKLKDIKEFDTGGTIPEIQGLRIVSQGDSLSDLAISPT